MRDATVPYEEVCKAFKSLKKEKKPMSYKNVMVIVGELPVSTFYTYKKRYLNNVQPIKTKSVPSAKSSEPSKDYIKGWKDAMKSARVYITSQLKKGT